MGSNPNPWAPYDSYTDCSQGVCNIYCPQWCYLIFPPPPPSFLDDGNDSSSHFSPLLIALIGILTSAFILVSYYTLVSKYCHRRRDNSSSSSPGHDRGGFFSASATEPRQRITNAAAGEGLNDSLIKSITVYKYRKGDGFVDGSDCSVCLSEFEEDESLRLLPKCNHAFHLPCIDTWLKSHSNCPLCRAFVTGVNPTADAHFQSSSAHQTASDSGNRGGETSENNSGTGGGYSQHLTGDSVVIIEDLETGSRSINGGSHPQPPEEERRETKDEVPQPIRRSVSLNSNLVVSIADILRESEDDEKNKESAGVGTSQQRQGEEEEIGLSHGKTPPSTAANQRSVVSNFLVRSSVAMKRSVSTGRFIGYDEPRDYRLPN